MFLQSSASESIASLLEGSCDFAVACGKAGTVRLSVTVFAMNTIDYAVCDPDCDSGLH